MPMPKQTPWLRNSCHILRENEAPISPSVSKKTPMRSVVRVPQRRVVFVASGEISRAQEMERPPTKAKSRYEAPG